jgi:flagellar basal-body rod protein FlgF
MGNYGETALVRGLSFLAEKQASIANNLANVDTASFKRRIGVAAPQQGFDSLLDRELDAVSYTERTDRQAGVVRETGNLMDVSLAQGQWLRVEGAGGKQMFTRSGELRIGDNGYLLTRDGLNVLDMNGQPISLGNAETVPSEIRISPNGTISNPVNGQTWGPLAVVSFPEEEALAPVGKGLYRDTRNPQTRQAADGVQQGYLEGSNVDSLQELVAMISVERSFAATQKALTGLGRIQDNLITNILR